MIKRRQPRPDRAGHTYNEALTPVFPYLVPPLILGTIIPLFVNEKKPAVTNETSKNG